MAPGPGRAEHHGVLQVADLSVRYGRAVRALENVTLSAPEGSIVAVLGANGAGKSTLLRAISGTLPLHRGRVIGGSIILAGRRVDDLAPAELVAAGVVQVPEGRQIFTTMSVEENLRAGASSVPRAGRAAARDRVFDLFPLLAERRDQRAGLLSGGEQQMLAIGRALMSRPGLLLLDEPSLGLAPKMVAQIARIIVEINADRTTVVLVEQNAAMALRIAQHAVVLEVGRVAGAGLAADFDDSSEIAALYLGGHPGDAAAARAGPAAERRARRPLTRWIP
jgi:branched-chain amino acid transport system ATP-binding protein